MSQTRRNPTIRQVALSCNVSPMTVSAVLNNKSSEVGKETRERVLKAVRDMGYRPVPAVRHARQVPIYGVVAAVEGNSLMQPGYYNSVLRSILTEVDRLGHNVLLFSNAVFHQDPQQSVRLYCDGRCDGIIIIAPPPGSPLVHTIQERGLPFVVIGSTGTSEDVPSVDVHNISEAYRAVEYLIAQGHRRIAFLGDPSRYPGDPFVPYSVMQRRQGYEQALTAHGIALEQSLLTNVGGNDVQTYQQAVQLLRQPVSHRPTAIFCWHDPIATEAYRAVQDVGLRIPADVSLIGFDDNPSSSELEPALTSMRQPYDLMAETAVKLLTEQIEGQVKNPTRRFLPAELIVRRSVAPPPSVS